MLYFTLIIIALAPAPFGHLSATVHTELVVASTEAVCLEFAKTRIPACRAQQDLRRDDDMVVLTRSDTGEKLGIVSADYEVVQPHEILEFFRDLVEGQGFQIETAGTMFGGKRYWALAKVTEATIAGWDKIGSYVLLCTSADGSRATEGRETTVRVVCHNTISAALSEDVKRAVRISHRQAFDEKAMKEKLGLVRENFAAFIESANLLTKVKVTDAAAEDFVLKLLRPSKEAMELIAAEAPADTLAALLNKPFKPKDAEQDLETIPRRPRGCDDILALFHGAGQGSLQKGSAGTAWGLVNAVTEYVDHHATAKTDSHRLDRAWFGSGDEMKTDALVSALQLA